MATTVLRLFRAMAAVAMVFGLLGCSGGGDEPSVPTANPAAVAFSGPAVDSGTTFDGQPRMKALSAPASESVTKPVIDFSFVLATGGTKVAQAGLEISSAITVDELLDWGKATYSTLFPGSATTLRNVPTGGNSYDYRDYQGNLVGVQVAGDDVGGVYGLGPYTGGALTRFGSIKEFECRVKPTLCGPKVTRSELLQSDGRVIPTAGAVDIPAKVTKLRITYDQALNCAGVGGTGVVGQIVLTVACSGQTVTFTPGLPGEERWPFGTVNTVTVAGLRGLDGGYPSASMSVSFTTRSVATGSGTKVYVANWDASAEGGHDVTIIDGATQAIRPVNLGDTLNSVSPQRLVVDREAGVVYVGAGGDRFYRVDIETGLSLTPLYPDPTGEFPGYWHTVQGLVIAGQDVCTAMGRQDFTEYIYRNRLLCWNRFTLQPSFRSNSDYLAKKQMIVMEAVAVPERNTFYVVAAEALAYDLMVDETGRTLKQEFTPGSAGSVYEVDADTKAVVRRFTVGAGPRSAVYDAVRKRLIVANSGKTAAGLIELSVIDLETGLVTAKRLAGFTGDQRPQSVVIAQGQLWVSDYLSALVALNLTTFVETRRVEVGAYPVFFTEVAGKLYVPLPRATSSGSAVGVVDLLTYSLASIVQAGTGPWYVTGFTPSPQ